MPKKKLQAQVTPKYYEMVEVLSLLFMFETKSGKLDAWGSKSAIMDKILGFYYDNFYKPHEKYYLNRLKEKRGDLAKEFLIQEMRRHAFLKKKAEEQLPLISEQK